LRAIATARAAPLCSDPFALAIAGDEGIALAKQFETSFAPAELWLALRTAFIDRELQRLVQERRLSQIVLLGAGFDARAARMARAGVRWFEVDHPGSQADKRRRIASVDGYPADAATFAACDFEHEDFLDVLVAAGFDAGAPAAFVWEGVTLYLEESAVRHTLRRVSSACHPRSVLLFDSVGKKLAGRRTTRKEDAAVHASVEGMGEPIRFGVDDVLPLSFAEGFRYVRSTSFDELALEFTGTYDRSRTFRFQRITLASVTPP
jgi:methyltransferase (TIGR00027 family)